MTYGQLCYEEYSKARGGLDGAGQPLPDWWHLLRSMRMAWERAADAVRKSI